MPNKDYHLLRYSLLTLADEAVTLETATGPSAPDDYRILRDHVEHHLKLLDLFETRMTWAFNFALILYAGAFSALGPILLPQVGSDSAITSLSAVSPLVACSLVIAYSVVLPALVLAVCFLYADVSAFCAALNAGGLRHLRDAYKRQGIRLPGNLDPGALAFMWLERSDVGIKIDWLANQRVIIFFVAPVVGLLTSLVYFVQTWEVALWPRIIATGGVIVSGLALFFTYRAAAITWRARDKARLERVFEPDI